MRFERTEEIAKEIPNYDIDELVRVLLISQRTYELYNLSQQPKFQRLMRSGFIFPSPLANVVIPTNAFLRLKGSSISLYYHQNLYPEISQPLSPKNAFVKAHKISLLGYSPRPALDEIVEQQHQRLTEQTTHLEQTLAKTKQTIYSWLDFRDELFKRLVIYSQTHGTKALTYRTDCLGKKLEDPRPEITRQIFPNPQKYLETQLGIINVSETYARVIQDSIENSQLETAFQELTAMNDLLRKKLKKDSDKIYP